MLMKLGMMMHMGLQPNRLLKSETLKIQDGGRPRSWKWKNAICFKLFEQFWRKFTCWL